jgi:hypothetical protein
LSADRRQPRSSASAPYDPLVAAGGAFLIRPTNDQRSHLRNREPSNEIAYAKGWSADAEPIINVAFFKISVLSVTTG